MLSLRDQQVALKLKEQLAQLQPVLELRVFGSRARGDATAESDLDVFVLLSSLTPELRCAISEIAWQVGFDAGQLISLFVATESQLQRGPLAASPLLLNLHKEGILI